LTTLHASLFEALVALGPGAAVMVVKAASWRVNVHCSAVGRVPVAAIERLRVTAAPGAADPEDNVSAICPEATDDEKRKQESSAVSLRAEEKWIVI